MSKHTDIIMMQQRLENLEEHVGRLVERINKLEGEKK